MIQNPYLLHFHSTISFIPVESISWELALKPGYYTIIVPYTSILFTRVITVFRAHTTLARGRHPLPHSSAHLKSRPGKASTYRALPSRPKSTPRRSQGFGNLPESRPGLREIPYTTTLSSLWSYGVFVPKYPARVSVPLRIWGFASTIRTLPNTVGGLRKQAHKSLYLPLRTLALFPALWITLRTYITTLV